MPETPTEQAPEDDVVTRKTTVIGAPESDYRPAPDQG